MEILDCNHEALTFILLMQGGGFYPTVLIPELVCPTCHLDLTCSALSKADSRYGNFIPEEIGLEIPVVTMAKLDEWANDWNNRKWIPVEELFSDFQGVYQKADKFPEMSQVKLIDKSKLDCQFIQSLL